MIIYTIGHTKRTAREFFESLKFRNVQMLIDIRLKNSSNLLRFSTGGKDDLGYLLEFINCQYVHRPDYAPSAEILDAYKKKKISWPEYEERYRNLMTERKSVEDFLIEFEGIYETVCLLCSEPTPENCHRRLFAEMILERRPDFELEHIIFRKKSKRKRKNQNERSES